MAQLGLVPQHSAPVPPQNLDAEESVLGAMMLSPGAVETVGELLTPSDFYRESHGTIFRAAVALAAKGEPVDAITLVDFLEERSELERVGTRTRLHELASLVPATANAGHYARIVAEMAVLRRLQRAGAEISRLAQERPGDIPELLAQAEAELSRATAVQNDTDFEPVGSDLDEFYAQLAHAVETGEPILGLQTGFPDLDKLTTGFHGGQLIVVGARPTMGKSVLGQNIAENAADYGLPSGFISLEMSKRELQIRALSRETHIAPNQIRSGRLSTDQLAQIATAIKKLEKRPFYIDERSSLTPPELAARARRLKRKHDVKLLVVDYLQLMFTNNSRSNENRQQEVATISRNLKQLAKDLDIPIIAIAQINRGVEHRADKRPTMADLKESGAIEADADLVLLLYREEAYKPVDADKAGAAELIVGKNRMGETGTVHLLFLGRRQTFATPVHSGASQ